jgi:hypothetical protein
LFYNKFIAFAKKVTLNGSTREQYPPPIAYTPKNAATEIKKRIQNKTALGFLVVVSMLRLIYPQI